MSKIKRLGIDLAKNVFELVGVGDDGTVVYSKRVRRGAFLRTVLNLDTESVYLEACGSAHHWGRALAAQGVDVHLLPPHRVRAFVRGSKNDRNDAEAIAMAGGQASVREVAIKTLEQQDIQSLHRVRAQTVAQRTAVINQLRGLLAEYGIVMATGRKSFREGINGLLEDAENGLTSLLRALVAGQLAHYQALDDAVVDFDHQIEALGRQIEVCQRLQTVPGVGALTATAWYATVGDANKFTDGRQASASLGLVPRQHSSGERQRLLGITKRGDRYLRTLLIHGARAMVRHAENMPGRQGRWLRERMATGGANKAAVALANKNARTLWALMAHGGVYQATPCGAPAVASA